MLFVFLILFFPNYFIYLLTNAIAHAIIYKQANTVMLWEKNNNVLTSKHTICGFSDLLVCHNNEQQFVFDKY